MNTILKTEKLTKEFEKGRGAIEIDMEIRSREIVGFIGPNGAGKTTTLNMITGLIKPDYGNVSIFNHRIKNENDYLKISHKIGSLPSEGGLFDFLTPRKILSLAASLYGIDSEKVINKYASKFKLDLDIKIKNLSLGNKRKVGIIQALMHNPKLLILDEPTSGLDPLMQKQVLELIHNVKENDGAVLLSSHNLSEVQNICDRIIMIKAGKIIYSGKTNEILKKLLKRFRIENVSEEFYKEIQALSCISSHKYILDDVIAYVDNPKEMIDFLIKHNKYNFYIERPSLEEAFTDYY